MAETIQIQSDNTHQNHIPKIPLTVLIVPLPAQGHLNQLLHLSRRISSRGIPVHFAASATHNRQALTRVHGFDPSSAPNLQFHDLPTPQFSNPSPNPNAAVKFPTQILPCLIAAADLRLPVLELARSLSSTARKLVVIYDSVIPHVVEEIHSIANAESYSFQSTSAFTMYSYHWEAAGKPELPLGAELITEAPSVDGSYPEGFEQFSNLIINARSYSSGDIFNTSRAIEGFYVDLLAEEKKSGTDKNWALGPFTPVPERSVEKRAGSGGLILEWLDKHDVDSVIYVSFGTTSTFSDEQIAEIGLGLERSEQKFVWVLREADRGNVFEGDVRKAPLPDGFEERVKSRGLIVRDWAPQLEILGHPSIGGFVSHCGWNSCMESISMGVPIVAWPMHSDQPKNAVLVTTVLRIGVQIKEWTPCEDGIVSSDEVENVVRRLMASEEGDGMRKRAAGLGNDVRESVVEGKEMDSFIAHVMKL